MREQRPHPSITLQGLRTWNPPTCYTQEEASQRLQEQAEDNRTKRILRHIYRQSAIETRHTAVGRFGRQDPDAIFRDRGDGKWIIPTTAERNRVYQTVTKEAAVALADQTLEACPEIEAQDITHLVTASCTGFYNPGPDYHIIRELGLRKTVKRSHLGFMGCYAAFPAMRLAQTICQADPEAVVLIQCMELCSLHLQLDPDNPEALVAGSLFADGAGCAIISTRSIPKGHAGYELKQFASALTEEGEDAMAWDIGDQGFDIVLSGYVPRILGENIRSTVLPAFADVGWEEKDVDFWCVHPGGKAILDQVEKALDLPEEAFHVPRDILRRYGNMSSATILFLLKQGLETHPPGTRTAAMAFGPGLTVEMGFMEQV